MTEYCGYKRPTPNADSCPKSDDVIHIVLAVYDPSGTYSQNAGVTMTSIFENTHSKVTVHILHDNTLTDDNRQKFIRTAEKYSQGLELHDVTRQMAGLGRNITESISRSFTVGSLFRLAAQDIITADKAIYLDCDIIVRLDIRELWKIDIDGYCMAAVIDGNVRYKSAFSSWRVRCRLNGCDSYSYVNSGVVVMNLAEIRKRGDFFRISAEWLRKHIHNASCPDQDAYNSIFRGSIKIIDSRFNVISGTNPGGITENSVLHFAGAVKPWEISGHPSQTLYWKYYTHSAWGENSSREELIDAISARAKISAPEYRLFSRNIRKIFNVLPEAISSAKLVLRDIFYRLKYRLTRR